jgi:hypothetical protein
MKISKRQLRRIIREAEGSTKKHDDDSALRGGQSKLPDGLQKGIIDKTVEDREAHEEEEREEKNESVRITRRLIRRIIREEKRKLLNEITPGDAGIAAAGGGTPADQGFAAADADDRERNARYEEREDFNEEKAMFLTKQLTLWYDAFDPQDDGQADLIEDKLSECYDAIYKELIDPWA